MSLVNPEKTARGDESESEDLPANRVDVYKRQVDVLSLLIYFQFATLLL